MRTLSRIGAILAATLWGLSAGGLFGQTAVSRVVVAPVIEQSVLAGQEFVGTVVPEKRVVVGSAVDGRVIEFPIDEGQRVEAGATLAQLLTDTISLELQAAEAELELRREELAELENGSLPEEIAQALARMHQAQAQWQYAQARYQRSERLFRENMATSQEELDEARSAAQVAKAAYEESQAAYELIQKGPRAEKIAQARARLAMQQALVERLRDQIRKHTVVSRFAGYVVAEYTEVGAWLKRGDPVAEIIALDQVEVLVQVPENYIGALQHGHEVRVDVPALPQHTFLGTIRTVVPQADLRARTFPVKVLVTNTITPQGPLLKAGMLARVVLPIGKPEVATLVPKDALVLGGTSPMVFVVVQDASQPGPMTVRAVPVELGVAHDGSVQVRGAVRAGDLVVVEGNERLRPGQPVEVLSRRSVLQGPETPANNSPGSR
ncbi:MAG: hemolysin D [Pirellulaceae bacterium]|nr:MAG: hemolysin D [Pirellulaceae bacterium]